MPRRSGRPPRRQRVSTCLSIRRCPLLPGNLIYCNTDGAAKARAKATAAVEAAQKETTGPVKEDMVGVAQRQRALKRNERAAGIADTGALHAGFDVPVPDVHPGRARALLPCADLIEGTEAVEEDLAQEQQEEQDDQGGEKFEPFNLREER